MKHIREEEYNQLKRMGFTATYTVFNVSKEYIVYPPKNYICNGVKPLGGVGIKVRCTQNCPYAISIVEPKQKLK